MIVTYDHEGSCGVAGCENKGIVFDAPTYEGHMSAMICGACGVNFTDRCTPKE